jgi:2-polyprenyl-3-methyl-5-hydroxy-6-metoxy-1,4-benzoquinol methylase
MMLSDAYLQPINCPVCHSNDFKIMFSIEHTQSNVLEILNLGGTNEKVDIVACKNCTHVYMTPVIKQELMDRYYSILNSEFYHTGKEVVNYNAKEYADYVKVIQGLKRTGTVLEIGCGNGFLLKELENHGYECAGVEPSPMAFEYAKNKLGLNVENKFLEESSFYNKTFDIVILIDVAEHISDMQTFMQQIKKVLKEGAIIFIGTGNIHSLNARIAGKNWGYFLSWEHLSFFNKKSMHYLLNKNGFTNIIIRETSLQHKPVHNIIEFGKNIFKKVTNPFLKKKYYHGVTFDHFIVIATNQKR